MRPMDKPCANTYSFEFHDGAVVNNALHRRKVLGSSSKPTPSKWDDAQKWLVGLSGRGDPKHAVSKPRNSNADDRRLLSSLSQRGRDSCSSADGTLEYDIVLAVTAQEDEGETKKIDCSEALWRTNEPIEDSSMVVRSLCLRDAGTEMTPIASKEPSRTGTPLRATTPVSKSPISSRSSTPGRYWLHDGYQAGMRSVERRSAAVPFGWPYGGEAEADGRKFSEINGSEQGRSSSSLESRAMAWDEAERAKYMAR
ncbi:hypothetical protein BHE74_00031262 [Ensete ventricosum]|uniref:Uncharacterized protein n=1 Tax=Ensete ventricosum TaxID=4639 RepID=A0A426ZT60_ENSVE|nr:hypothetical protein B296_00013826 [Ensete ventricosum]RWW28046.1 hypothetical protein GW17_00007494 [Ensete ventricosum]RWW61667.1 hypothetical protein BHE74_00031262 [Ensete ventricosum]RZR83711.1 hypothetical protein BHM03_00010396 [Ensete ventricosum]